MSHRISPRCVLTPDATGTVQRLTLASQRVRLGYPPLTFFAADQALGLLGAFADVHRGSHTHLGWLGPLVARPALDQICCCFA